MTTQQLIDYYADLLILQYLAKPKAYAHIQTLVTPVIMSQLPLDVQAAFSVDTAEGVQLDVIGKYAGISRNVVNFTGPIVLDDDDYRLLIKMKITQNNSGSSLADIQTLIRFFFPGALSVFDYQNMTMDYFFNAAYGSADLAEVLVRLRLLPKPMGVQLGALIYSVDIDNLFGYRTYNLGPINVSGMNSYDDYQMDRPWLSYANAITF